MYIWNDMSWWHLLLPPSQKYEAPQNTELLRNSARNRKIIHTRRMSRMSPHRRHRTCWQGGPQDRDSQTPDAKWIQRLPFRDEWKGFINSSSSKLERKQEEGYTVAGLPSCSGYPSTFPTPDLRSRKAETPPNKKVEIRLVFGKTRAAGAVNLNI